MSSLPISDGTELRYEPPRNVQFSVFLDNRVGKLLELVQIFDGKALRLVALSVDDSADYAVVRIVTSRSDLARRLLKRHNMAFSEKSILVVELGPTQTLAKLCLSLLSAELNIHYAYPLMVRPAGAPVIALQCDDPTLATQVLLRKQFQLMGENDLGDNATNPEPENEDDPGPSAN